MKSLKTDGARVVFFAVGCLTVASAVAESGDTLSDGQAQAVIAIKRSGDLRTYELKSNAALRENRPADKQVTFSETADHAILRSGNTMFDGLYAMAVHEAQLNSVSEIKDNAYGNGDPIQLEAFQTGESWSYVWTRDLAYSVNLALAGFDPQRSVNSLLFKTSTLKPSVANGLSNQIIQDTGSGGSYPVSTDRIVWALGAWETLKYLSGEERDTFLKQIYPILHDTIEQDRQLVFDPDSGLFCGEQSFLDWREQTYPGWTKDNVLPIALSKSLSVNAANCFLLQVAGDCANRLKQKDDAARYSKWAAQLKGAINEHFFDPEAGLYSTYLLSDGICDLAVHRYDLLGESLAILLGIADPAQAASIIEHYPVGPHGPSVVWPQERTVPIYHNQGIWPFVTAYWTKAAKQAGNPAAVNAGIGSLMKLSAINLSNMENYDFVSGLAEVKGKALTGPVINSRRQLWSVAGYLSIVQDVVFGLETSWEGIRFQPYVTTQLRNETFGSGHVVELRNFSYRGTRHSVRIHLPATSLENRGVCAIQDMELNGKKVGGEFIAAEALKPANQWDIYLQAPEEGTEAASIRRADVLDGQLLYGPVQPTWDEAGEGGITVEDGRLVLHYRHADSVNVTFNIYRDGKRIAKDVKQLSWVDESSGDYSTRVHCYAVEAVDPESGNTSHPTPFRCYYSEKQKHVVLAGDMKNRGGKLVSGHHFEDWGQARDELRVKSFAVDRSGHYAIRAKFSNGSGPVNTGITCAVKKLDVLELDSGTVVASGYLVMPQSGNWGRWDMSSPVRMQLNAGETYVLRIQEDDYSRNMSYLEQNARYTALPGGGDGGYNYVNIAALHIDLISSLLPTPPTLLSSQ